MSFRWVRRLMNMHTPPDVAMMLDANTRLYFESLPRSRRRRYLDPILQARQPDTREHRIARAIRMLHEERSR